MYTSPNMATEPLNFFYEIIDKCIRHDIDFYINFDYNHGFISISTDMNNKEKIEESDDKIDKITDIFNEHRKYVKEEQNESENDN